MKTAQKIAFSLLITVIVFSVFTFFAFSGLFNYIEATFYNRRITRIIESDVENIRAAIDAYHSSYRQRLSLVLKNEAIPRLYRPNQAREDIFTVSNLFGALKEDYPGFLYVRFIDDKGKIHYSTYQKDYTQTSPYERIYEKLETVDPAFPFSELLVADAMSASAKPGDQPVGASKFIIDDKGGRFIYSFPVYDSLSLYKGSAVFYVSTRDLELQLIKKGLIGSANSLTLVPGGYVLNADAFSIREGEAEILSRWREGSSGKANELLLMSETGKKYYLFSSLSRENGNIGMLVPEEEFALNQYLKILLLVCFFLSVFLIVFLIFSLKQDNVLIIKERVRRFQIEFFKEYFEKRDEIDWERWHQDIAGKKEEVKSQITRGLLHGLGKIKPDKEREISDIIDSSWDDLVAFIDARIESKQEKALPVSQIESLIQKILENKNLIVNLPSSNVQTVQGVSQTPSVVVPEREEVVPAVEEEPQEVEEVAEAEAIPTAEQAPHAEETAEEVEEIPEVEELEEAEEAPQAAEGKGEVVEEVEAVHEAEEAVVPEAKKAEVEAETAPAVEEEPQEIEVAAEAEAIPTAEQAPHAEETAEEVEEIPQVEELEEAEEVHQVTEELEELPEVIDTTDKEAELEKVSGGSFSYASSGQFYRGMDRTLRYPQALPVEELSKDSAVDIPKPFSHEWRVIQGLISKGIIEVYPIISVLHVESPTPAVTMREGVFSVRDELLKVKETEVGDQKFRKLVDEVLKGEEKGSGSEGIENIIGVKAVELSDFAGAPAVEEESAKPTIKGNLIVTEDGIDYDSYLLGFKAGSIGVLRSLMKVSQKMNGMYAALFGFHDGFWKPDYSLGMDLGNLSTFVFGEKDGLTEDIFGSRMVIYIKTNTTGLKVLDEKLSKSERMYMKGSMFIPVRYNGLSTCLFIGLKDHTLSVEQYFERLKEL